MPLLPWLVAGKCISVAVLLINVSYYYCYVGGGGISISTLKCFSLPFIPL